MAARVVPTQTACGACGTRVLLDVEGWLWYSEDGALVGGQAHPCSCCGADVFALVGEPSLFAAAAVYWSGVTH